MVTSPLSRRASRELSRSEVDRLVDQNSRLRAEGERLEHELTQAKTEVVARDAEVEKLSAEVARLCHELDEARRAAKRQAAPFSKGDRKRPSERKRPGRKPGEAYGKKARRLPPGDVDEDVAVELPGSCPRCGEDLSAVEPDKWYEQFQEELVAQVLRRRHLVASGHCPNCHATVRGRHRDLTSDALGAAAVMLGPKVLALSAWLHYGCGLSAAKISRLYGLLGLSVTPGRAT